MNRKERRKKKGIEYARKQNKEIEFRRKCRELNDLVDYFSSVGAIGIVHKIHPTKIINIGIQFRKDKVTIDTKNWGKEEFVSPLFPHKYSKVYEGIECFYLSKK